MKLNGIVNLYQACYDAIEAVKREAEPQAVAFNGFAWYSAGKEAVDDGAVAVATLTGDLLTVSNLLSQHEREQMVIQFRNAARELGFQLTVA